MTLYSWPFTLLIPFEMVIVHSRIGKAIGRPKRETGTSTAKGTGLTSVAYLYPLLPCPPARTDLLNLLTRLRFYLFL